MSDDAEQQDAKQDVILLALRERRAELVLDRDRLAQEQSMIDARINEVDEMARVLLGPSRRRGRPKGSRNIVRDASPVDPDAGNEDLLMRAEETP